jgi:transposase-like protein
VYVEDQKFPIEYPRMQEWNHRQGKWVESPLKSYTRLHERGQFSEQLLTKAMKGLAGRRYEETVGEMAGAFGVSRSAVSRHVVAASAVKLAAFRERPLAAFIPFAIFLDTVHRGDAAFIVALGIDLGGHKMALGFWEGETENREICDELFRELERRGLKLSAKTLFIVDGGKGVISALNARYKGDLLLQRCGIHKIRNITRHLPKSYRGEVTRRFQVIYGLNDYAKAKEELASLEKWLRNINESAADSLLEAGDTLLTVHRLKVPALLRKALYSTNPIESLFSMVRKHERNIRRYRGSSMKQRWLGAVLMEAEKSFRRVKGHASISEVMATIENRRIAK